MKKGISLISLIITIIVVIILAAIAIFSGFGSIEYANLAKFTGEFSDYEAAVQNEYIIRKQNYAINGNPKSDKEIFEEMAGGAEGDINPEVAAKIGVGRAFAITNTIKGYAPDKFGRAYITTEGRVYLDPADAFPYNSDDGLKRYASSNIILDGEVAEAEPEPEPEEKTIKNSIKVGDWVEFDNYSSTEEIYPREDVTGTTQNSGTVVMNKTSNWRVWKNNGDGTIDIVPGVEIYDLNLKGSLGADNCIDILGMYSEAFAKNSKYLTTVANARLFTKEEWEEVYNLDSTTYKGLLPNLSVGYWLATKSTGEGQQKGLYVVGASGTPAPRYLVNNLGGDVLSHAYVLPIVTIGEGLEINQNEARGYDKRDGSTSAMRWVLKVAD